VVTAIFEAGTNILDARQLVNERLGELGPQLPAGVSTPRLTPLAASTSKMLMVGLTSETGSLEELRTLADWTMQSRLRAVRGVAHVEVFGGDVKQYQILVRPERLQQAQLSLAQVVTAARQSTGFGGAGFVETPTQRLPIQQRTRIESPDDLAAATVMIERGVPITLGQVADVTVGSRDKVGDAVINGKRGVLLVIHKQPSFNTLAVTEDVQVALESLRQSLPDGIDMHVDLFRQATFIERAISNLNAAIVVGAVLVALILIAFLFQWRTVVISLTAIPLSLLGAVLILRACGASLNAMTLGGLAIALGELVDDAIVDVENVLRRLRENRRRPDPAPPLQVVLSASLEVRSAVVYASFIVILVFVPVFFMGGLGAHFSVRWGWRISPRSLCHWLSHSR
jgi:Cu/Ag efflux pump CusA